jgi:hypothetical protein
MGFSPGAKIDYTRVASFSGGETALAARSLQRKSAATNLD